jgi:hypothetical protein
LLTFVFSILVSAEENRCEDPKEAEEEAHKEYENR